MRLVTTKFNFLFFLTMFFLTSCGEIKNEVAGDQLVGTFSGKATFLYKHSLLNIGLNDESKEVNGIISIFKNQAGQIYIATEDGDLKLSGVTWATNGIMFNISLQNVPQKNGSTQSVQGLQYADLDGLKFDGIYYIESKTLSFVYGTSILYDYIWTKEKVSVVCSYEFYKI